MSEEGNGGSNLGFFLAGLGMGAILALLFAPRSGKETREYIAGKAEEGRDYVKAKTEDLRRQAEGAVDKGKDLVTKQKELLSAALEAGKQAYQEEKAKAK
ncbi:MAG: YtxH domain-containing protein [Terriglobia bacterium]|jgi:gas vesicle protein